MDKAAGDRGVGATINRTGTVVLRRPQSAPTPRWRRWFGWSTTPSALRYRCSTHSTLTTTTPIFVAHNPDAMIAYPHIGHDRALDSTAFGHAP